MRFLGFCFLLAAIRSLWVTKKKWPAYFFRRKSGKYSQNEKAKRTKSAKMGKVQKIVMGFQKV